MIEEGDLPNDKTMEEVLIKHKVIIHVESDYT